MAQKGFADRVAARMKQLGYGAQVIGKILKPLSKGPAVPGKAFSHVTPVEEELMKHMHSDGLGVKQIAAAVRRSTDTVSKHLFRKCGQPPAKVGRKVAITEGKYKQIYKGYQRLLRKSPGKEVPVKMVKKELKLKCSLKTLSRAFWAHGVHFRPLYEKPDLSPQDIKDRLAWAEAHAHRSAPQWGRVLAFQPSTERRAIFSSYVGVSHPPQLQFLPLSWQCVTPQGYVHAVIDSKTFQVYHTGKFRAYAARRTVRGAYRVRNRVFTPEYIKPSATLKQNTGAKAVHVTCAIGNGKVLMWHVTPDRWNGEAAAHMYAKPLRRCLEKEYPGVRGPWRVLEDNDPTGYKSAKGLAAKKEAGIISLDLPKRSPDLNPLDFSFWSAVNKKMRATERNWPKTKRETRKAYLARLRRAAFSLSGDYITNIVGALAGRVQQLQAAKGNYFPEGGHC
eukprot:s1435_g16.t1